MTEKLNESWAQEESAEFDRVGKVITKLIKVFPSNHWVMCLPHSRTFVYSLDGTLKQGKPVAGAVRDAEFRGAQMALGETPIRSFAFWDHQETQMEPYRLQEYGINNARELYLRLHRDSQTETFIRREEKGSPFHHIFTVYYFDEQGHYLKLVQIPTELANDRPLVKVCPSGGCVLETQLIVGEMETEDFTLARLAYEDILRGLRVREIKDKRSVGRVYEGTDYWSKLHNTRFFGYRFPKGTLLEGYLRESLAELPPTFRYLNSELI